MKKNAQTVVMNFAHLVISAATVQRISTVRTAVNAVNVQKSAKNAELFAPTVRSPFVRTAANVRVA